MTSGEVAHLVEEQAANEGGPADNSTGIPGPATPAPERKDPGIAAQAARALTDLARHAPGATTAAPTSNSRAQPVSAPATAPNGAQAPPATGTAVPGGAVAPQPGGLVAPPEGAAPPSNAAAPPASGEPAAPPPGIDPEMIASLAPAAMTAGSMAMMALPMLAQALSGLAGGGSGAGSGGSKATDTAAAGAAMTPEAQRALEALKKLEALYGTDGDAAGTASLGARPSGSVGSGAGATAIKARALFQKNAAKAFDNLDNDLARYISGLAGDSRADRKAVVRLIRDVNVQLAELGPSAYTKEGQRKVHQILSEALRKAQTIVRGGQAKATETAAMVDRLTAQYLNGIAGKHTRLASALPGDGRPRSPLDPGKYRITSHYGPRGGKHHGGLDLAAPSGTPIYAATGGTVVKAGNFGDGYGYQVRIRSADGTETIYAHQTPGSIRVQSGQRVAAGTVIGAVGSTGNSTGPHLHYEVRRNGRAVEPVAYLASQGVRV
ncbi:peptidoglycan DD-metalloendopeptidase family protein [Nocardia gipuzkoensis]|uniref:peptidoglycan DD-metalloendopeptidase family protein n=1 Tax=Nocardia gipuzkoensis TaxID=2749991 RepID=UPI00237D7C87|nr:peptidoglycan DD-metalloendopeptidase family protein [Nocardia gipuzkoensis]MDE1668869.1 peptidoglycan DD-metalloendopeptidase family protein [Nocardia gipuzkoensis]